MDLILWRRARASDRRVGLALVLLLAWCAAFEALERALGWDDLSPVEWRWWHESIDLAMCVGWIPFAVALLRRHERRGAASLAEAAPAPPAR